MTELEKFLSVVYDQIGPEPFNEAGVNVVEAMEQAEVLGALSTANNDPKRRPRVVTQSDSS